MIQGGIVKIVIYKMICTELEIMFFILAEVSMVTLQFPVCQIAKTE